MKKIVVVHGPTASGKSDIALKLARDFGGYLISADSRMVYRGMDIGTNKDKGNWKDGKYFVNGIEEYMVDVANPDERFTVDDWVKRVEKLIENDKRLPIIVGGTNLYLEALIYNYKLPAVNQEGLRAELEKQAEETGLPSIVERIKEIDPEIEEKIDIYNPRRVIRAAEICLQTKKPLDREKGELQYEVLQVGITKEREELYTKINKRVVEMEKEGLVEEVRALKQKYGCDLPAMTGIGYRQICQYLKKEVTLKEAMGMVKRDTRRYAKRQLTWYKKADSIKWIKDYDEAKGEVESFI